MLGNNPNYGTKLHHARSSFQITPPHALNHQTSSNNHPVIDPTSTLQESAGPIASDSLAAESNAFSQNRNGAPQGVSGASSTFANTNTSGATRLDPASDAEARKAEEDWSKEQRYGNDGTAYPDAAGGQSKSFAGEDTTRGGSRSGSAGTAPSYVNSQHVDVGVPKGQNLTEGGFKSDDSKNASFNSDIGSKNDPGRLAEPKMQRENAVAAGDAGMSKTEGHDGR